MNAFADPAHDMSPKRLAEVVDDEGWQVVDVRETYERDAGHIAGSRHVELERLAGQADTIDRDRPVVFYCRLGNRSAMATQAFRSAGYDAHNLAGGVTAWAAEGLPLEPEGGHVAEH